MTDLAWALKGQAAVGRLAGALVLFDLLTSGIFSPGLALFQLLHVGLSCATGFGLLGPRAAALVTLYLWLVALGMVAPHETQVIDLCWGLVKAAAPVTALGVLCPGKCCKRSFCIPVLVGMVAAVMHIALLFKPMFVPENTMPKSGTEPTIVETPELRARYCHPAAKTPERFRYLCEGVQPMSWEEAERRADETLEAMTAAERHSLMQGVGWQAVPSWLPLPLPAFPKRGYYMGNTPPIPRLGLPALKLHDAGNGFRNNPPPVGRPFTTVMWPCSLAFGATWDPDLVGRVAGAIGREYRGKGANVILGPSVQVQRVARNGRNFEYMSGEDPYLGAQLSHAYVRGVQGEGVIACLKHYGFNEQETFRNGGNFVVDERTAWEIYYAPFEAGVAAGAGSVMCSYNRINGTYACASEGLLARDLKRRMGFRGFVMSDWWALHDPPELSVVRGFDQEMPGAGGDTRLGASELRAMEDGRAGDSEGLSGLSGDRVYTDAARRIVAATWKMRIHERPSCTPGADCDDAIQSDQRSQENSDLARRTATESVVLLKNDGVLPVDPGRVKTIALVGLPLNATSVSTQEAAMAGDYYSGGGSGHCYVERASLRTPLVGISERAHRAGIRVLAVPSNDPAEAESAARSADLVMVLAATTAEEGRDRDSLSLDGDADGLIPFLLQLGRPVVVLAQVPGAVVMPWREDVQAIAMMFLGGEHTSAAWEAVVFGDVSPSGKLPIMLPKGMEGVIEPGLSPPPAENHYSEGLFSSYRSRNAAAISAFPFGHGLSYTSFTYAEPVQLPKGECRAYACVKTSVTNSGTGRPGAEVAQAYVEFPPEAEEPKHVLRGFRKTAVLSPGEGEEVVFNFTERDLSVYRHGAWRLQRGVRVHVGASSADLRHSLALEDPA